MNLITWLGCLSLLPSLIERPESCWHFSFTLLSYNLIRLIEGQLSDCEVMSQYVTLPRFPSSKVHLPQTTKMGRMEWSTRTEKVLVSANIDSVEEANPLGMRVKFDYRHISGYFHIDICCVYPAYLNGSPWNVKDWLAQITAVPTCIPLLQLQLLNQ